MAARKILDDAELSEHGNLIQGWGEAMTTPARKQTGPPRTEAMMTAPAMGKTGTWGEDDRNSRVEEGREG